MTRLSVRLNWKDSVLPCAAPPRSCSLGPSTSSTSTIDAWTCELANKTQTAKLTKTILKPCYRMNTEYCYRATAATLLHYCCYFAGFRAGETGCLRNETTEVTEPVFILSNQTSVTVLGKIVSNLLPYSFKDLREHDGFICGHHWTF